MQDEIIKQLLKRIDSLERENAELGSKLKKYESRVEAAPIEKKSIADQILEESRKALEEIKRESPPLEPHPWIPRPNTVPFYPGHDGQPFWLSGPYCGGPVSDRHEGDLRG